MYNGPTFKPTHDSKSFSGYELYSVCTRDECRALRRPRHSGCGAHPVPQPATMSGSRQRVSFVVVEQRRCTARRTLDRTSAAVQAQWRYTLFWRPPAGLGSATLVRPFRHLLLHRSWTTWMHARWLWRTWDSRHLAFRPVGSEWQSYKSTVVGQETSVLKCTHRIHKKCPRRK